VVVEESNIALLFKRESENALPEEEFIFYVGRVWSIGF
jgi:hypothetical protein